MVRHRTTLTVGSSILCLAISASNNEAEGAEVLFRKSLAQEDRIARCKK